MFNGKELHLLKKEPAMPKKYTACLCFTVFIGLICQMSSAQTTLGKGSYATSGNFAIMDHTPSWAPDNTQPVISAKWWASLVNRPLSWPMFAHPLGFQTTAAGLDIGYPGAPASTGGGYSSSFSKSLSIGIEGLNVTATQVASYGHFSVTARWTSGMKIMEAVMAQGLPFVYFKITGGSAKVVSATTQTVWYNQGGVLGITVGGKHFGVFAPTGSAWTGTAYLSSTLNGKDYLSVALLPDNTQATLDFYKKYAYSFVTTTRVDWSYDEPSARLFTSFSVVTNVKEGSENGTVFAMLRHQWLCVPEILTNYTYQSPRGVMKVTTGKAFTTIMRFNGILQTYPDTGYDPKTLADLVNGEGVPGSIGGSTYNKDLGKMALLGNLAILTGNTAKRDAVLACLKKSLEDWFTANGNPQFYYHKPWNRLIGYPAAFYSDTRLCDHHFHYGYYLQAAAFVAKLDPEWAKPENWGGMVNMLVRDVNSWDDNDPLFGRFAYFEPYEGHGWADGTGFEAGNNQESSSESMNFNAGLINWGIATGNKTLRDEGIFMLTHESRAIEQYWWDVDDITFPKEYTHTCVGMTWSNGGAYSTWFSGALSAIHGINMLPNTPGHLYYGRNPSYNPKNVNEAGFNGWNDLFAEFLAYSDPATAVQKYNAGLGIEGGNTKAACYNEIFSLNACGKLDTMMGASIPTFAVYDKGNVRTYNAYNPDATDKIVTFNDGFIMTVPAKKQIHKTGPVIPVSAVVALKSNPVNVGHSSILVSVNGKLILPKLDKSVRRVALFDVRGRQVWESGVDKSAAIAPQVPRGVYYLKLYR
jgi:endoglucanase Acf2